MAEPTPTQKGFIKGLADEYGVAPTSLTNSYFRRVAGTTNVREAAAELGLKPEVYRQAEIKLTAWLRERREKNYEVLSPEGRPLN